LRIGACCDFFLVRFFQFYCLSFDRASSKFSLIIIHARLCIVNIKIYIGSFYDCKQARQASTGFPYVGCNLLASLDGWDGQICPLDLVAKLLILMHVMLLLQIKREISTMKLIRHPNVIKMHEV
jgi:hypothetical protein